MYGCWTDERIVGIVNGYLVTLREMTNFEILAALEKDKEDLRDSQELDEEDDK